VKRARLASLALGAVFGFFLAWGRLSDPDVIRRMLLLQEAYLYLVLASAVAVGFVGVHLLRRRGARALLTGAPIGWSRSRPTRRHVGGAALFGLGWAIACTCPGPVLAQVASGTAWSFCTLAGMLAGVKLQTVRAQTEGRPEGRPSPQQHGTPVGAYQMAASVSGSKK
jgi:uncharacterized membrane protein YedE/YeeE